MVIDVIDGSDFMFLGRMPRRRKRRKEVKEEIDSVNSLIATLKAAGGDPIIVHGMSNALGYVVDRIIDRARSYGIISLLCFHGHGAPGVMSIAGAYGPDMSAHLADLGRRRRRMGRRILAELTGLVLEVNKGKRNG